MLKGITTHEDAGEPQLSNSISPQHQPSRITIICHNMLIGAGIKHLLEELPFLTTKTLLKLNEVADASQLSDTDLFIVGESGPVESTLETIRRLRGTYPEARIAVIADSYDLRFVQLCADAGVTGFCQTGSRREVLIKSFELISLGELVLPTELLVSLLSGAGTVVAPKPQDSRNEGTATSDDQRGRKLSAREAEILRHVMGGAANKVIARKLDVSEATVKVHVKAILRKVGVANRTQAAMWASTYLPSSNALPLSS